MNKRYNSINGLLQRRFGERVYKVSLESGCGCPNWEGRGTKDEGPSYEAGGRRAWNGGCIYCNPASYYTATSPMGARENKGISEQLEEGIRYIRRRHQAKKVIAYFQSGSNTNAPAAKLAPIFNEAIGHPAVVGLAVSTRPDCVESEHVDMFSALSEKTMLWVEIGLQSAHNSTLDFIGRGHDVDSFSRACGALRDAGVPVCAHVILGLPGENHSMMIDTARFLNESGVWGAKIHNLHVLRGTRLEVLYDEGKVNLPSLEEYAGWVADFLEALDPKTVIHRVGSHGPRALTIAPGWSINNLAILNAVGEELERRDSRQGKWFLRQSPKS